MFLLFSVHLQVLLRFWALLLQGSVSVWRMPPTLSQSRLGGRSSPSNACTVIAVRMAEIIHRSNTWMPFAIPKTKVCMIFSKSMEYWWITITIVILGCKEAIALRMLSFAAPIHALSDFDQVHNVAARNRAHYRLAKITPALPILCHAFGVRNCEG